MLRMDEVGLVMGREPRLLLIDTCGREASVAVSVGTKVVAERRFGGRAAAELLLGEVRVVLAEAGVGLGEMAAMAVVRGPGSFTGVRVGLAAVKGMAEGARLGVVGMSRLEVLAGAYWERAEASVSVLDAGRGEMFWARFARGECVGEGVGEVELTEGEAVYRDLAEGGTVEMSAGRGVELALRRLRAGEVGDAMRLEAVYLRRTEAELLERQRMHRAAAGA